MQTKDSYQIIEDAFKEVGHKEALLMVATILEDSEWRCVEAGNKARAKQYTIAYSNVLAAVEAL